jgi:hypothetical protein
MLCGGTSAIHAIGLMASSVLLAASCVGVAGVEPRGRAPGGVGTLLGPEGSTVLGLVLLVGPSGPANRLCRGPPLWGAAGVGRRGVVGVAGCCLRTTQWTRASL